MANGNMEKVVDCKGQPYGRDNEEQSNLEVIDKHEEEERKEKNDWRLCVLSRRGQEELERTSEGNFTHRKEFVCDG